MAPDKRYEELASKWLNGTITPAEKLEFSAWYNAHPDDHVTLPESFAGDEEILKARILANVRKRMVKRLPLKRPIAIAAAIALAATASLLFWQWQTDEPMEQSVAIQRDVQPGGNRATLTLTDGRVIDLSSDKNGIIIGNGITYDDGSLVATTQESLELTTPKGGQYQLTLPDGTKVWLNSATSLKYPATFTKERRVVELVAGEAYFDVSVQPATDGSGGKRPFIVKTRQQEVEVLGTQFNVNAYADEADITTTLVEGAVNVRYPRANNGNITRLMPGQQAQLAGDSITVRKINTEEFTAWKDGYFYFNDANLYAVVKQLERWYDIKVVYKITASDDLFVGKIPRNVNLAVALNVLRTAGVSFELEGHTLTVLPKN